jgi:hypothetical protein
LSVIPPRVGSASSKLAARAMHHEATESRVHGCVTHITLVAHIFRGIPPMPSTKPGRFDARRASVAIVALAAATIGCNAGARGASTPAPVARSAASVPKVRPVDDTTLRRAVAEHYPEALVGGMGRRPLVWFAADSAGRVLRAASGRHALNHDSAGRESLDWAAATRALPGVPPSAHPGDLLEWGHVVTASDTVEVVWVRLQRGLASR